MKINRLLLIVCLLLLLFGIVLNGLQDDSLWMDEGYSAWLVRDEMRAPESPRDVLRYIRDSFTTSFERLRLDVHPPLYYLLLDGWTLLLGDSVFALRLLSALMALLALAATYAFGKLLFNTKAGLMALVLLGTSGFFVYYSREARSYGLYMALATIASLAYWRFWQKPSWWRGILYAVFGTALLYTHYTAIAVILVHGIYSLIDLMGGSKAPTSHELPQEEKKRKIPQQRIIFRLFASVFKLLSLFSPFIFIGLAFGAWWLLFGAEQFRINTSIEAAGALPSDWATVAALWLLLTSGFWAWFVAILFFSKLNPMSWIFDKEARPYKSILFLLLLGILPPIVLLLANAYGLAIFQLRYLIGIVPIWTLLIAYALSELWIPFLRNKQITAIISFILLFVLAYQQLASFREFWPEKPRWAEASLLASEARQPLEPAMVYLDERSPFAYYAYQDGLLHGMSIRVSWREFSPDEVLANGENLQNAERAWAFVAMQAPESWDTVAALSENRGIAYRDAVQWTIYYRFDESSDEQLSFNFGEALAYQNPFYRRFSGNAGEELCVPVALEALREIPDIYSIGLHLTRGYNEVLAQVDEGLGALSQGERFERDLCLNIPEAGTFHLRLVIYEWRDALQRMPLFERDLLWGDYLMLGVLEANPSE